MGKTVRFSTPLNPFKPPAKASASASANAGGASNNYAPYQSGSMGQDLKELYRYTSEMDDNNASRAYKYRKLEGDDNFGRNEASAESDFRRRDAFANNELRRSEQSSDNQFSRSEQGASNQLYREQQGAQNDLRRRQEFDTGAWQRQESAKDFDEVRGTRMADQDLRRRQEFSDSENQRGMQSFKSRLDATEIAKEREKESDARRAEANFRRAR